MKKLFIIACLVTGSYSAQAQSQEAQQLLLNWEKLTQFKQILQNMYDGWKVISKGYTTIKDISSGNFSLHKGFLDALLEVSPVVKKYKKVAGIIDYQLLIVKRYKAAFQQFKEDKVFTGDEILYMEKVYNNLFSASLQNLDELLMVITAGELRMNDEERLTAIDRIYEKIEDQFSFLEDFNTSTGYLSVQRKNEQAEIELSRKLRGN